MASEEKSSVKNLMETLACSLWADEHRNDSSNELADVEPPKYLKKKMMSLGFEILLKQKYLWQTNESTDGESAVLFALYIQFNRNGCIDKQDRELLENCIGTIENLSNKYEAASAMLAFLAAMQNSKCARKIKPQEMLSCFQLGILRHKVPHHLRSQTIQDQFEMLSDLTMHITSTSTSLGYNPFTLRKNSNFRVPQILVNAPVLNPNVPRSLNLSDHGPILHQDEGYVTPGSAAILEDLQTKDKQSHNVWTQNKPRLPSGRTERENNQTEASFLLDFKSTGPKVHMVQVLQACQDKPNPTDTKLFIHQRRPDDFTRDLRNLLLGIPSDCFPFDEEEHKFACAYGIYTQHISAEYLARFLSPALQCGHFAYLLKQLDRDKKKERLYMSFVESVQQYLNRYDLDVISQLSDHSSLTCMELQDFISALLQRLSCLLQLWKPDTHLLNHLYSRAQNSFVTTQNREHKIMVATIFEYCTNTYFELLESWLFHGEHHESLVTQSFSHCVKSRFFWSKGFRFNRAQHPGFLAGLEDQIFACGKNICLLKLTNPQDPLFSIDFNKIPRLKYYLTKESLSKFHAECEQYEEAVREACGDAPQFAELLAPQEYSQDQLKLWQEQARSRQEEYIQKLQDERLKKREQQATLRRKMLLEIETIEQRKKEEKEKEKAQDLKIMEEARLLDEDYWRLKELEKRKIEDYYKSLMEMIEKRAAHATCKTKSLETMKSLLIRKVSKEKVAGDTLDGTLEPPISATNSPLRLHDSSSSLPTSQESNDSDLFSIDIPDPPNVEALIRKIEEEEETILLTRETQRRLEELRCNRVEARSNRNKILSSEYNIFTGEASEKPADPFSLREKYMEGQTRNADEEAKSNRAKAQGSDMREWMGGFAGASLKETPLNSDKIVPADLEEIEMARTDSKNKKTNMTTKIENERKEAEVPIAEKAKEPYMSEAQKSALANKKKVLSTEFDIETSVQGNVGYKAHDSVASTSHDSSDGKKLPASENKALSVREEARRNKSKVMSHEFGIDESTHPRVKTNTNQNYINNQLGDKSPARNKQIGSDTRNNQMEISPTCSNQENRTHPKNNQIGNKAPCETNQIERQSCNRKKSNNDQAPCSNTESSSSDSYRSKMSDENSQYSTANESSPQASCEYTTKESSDDISQSTRSSSENLVTILSFDKHAPSESCNNPGSSDISSADETPKVNLKTKAGPGINFTWSFDSLIDPASDLYGILVQKYLKSSISVPLFIQYRLTNEAVMRLLLHKHHFASHLISLRNYFFLMDGSFTQSLTRDLSLQIRSNILLLLNPFKLNSILGKAVSCGQAGKMKNNLSFVVKNCDTIANLQESNVYQYISLSYKVDWPVNIVLTPEALTNYDKVFVFLMQVQQVSHTLQQVFVYLKERKHLEVNHLYIYRQINLFRHVMMQVLSAVQSYIHCSVLELPWHEMIDAFKKPVTLDSVYYRHVEYVKQIIFRCLLNKRSRGLAETLNAMFKTILHFYEELKRKSPEKNYERLVAIFQKFLKISLYFHDYCYKMVKTGYQVHNLDYLLHMLSLNDYFSNLQIRDHE